MTDSPSADLAAPLGHLAVAVGPDDQAITLDAAPDDPDPPTGWALVPATWGWYATVEDEVVLVRGRDGPTLYVDRGQFATVARAHDPGSWQVMIYRPRAFSF